MYSRRDSEPIFLFDLEWVSIGSRVESVLPFYKVERNIPRESPMGVCDMSVAAFAKFTKDVLPTLDWLCQAEVCESTSKKPRSGVLEIIQKSIDDCANPIPDKVSGCGEAVNILCMTYAEGDFSEIKSMSCTDDAAEKLLVEMFWELCQDARPAGWGIEFADLPVMLNASMRHGVYPTRHLDFMKGNGYLDIMKARFGRNEPCKQRDVAALLGYVPSGIDPLRNGGSDVARVYGEGRLPDILSHNYLDVEALRFVHGKYNGFFYTVASHF